MKHIATIQFHLISTVIYKNLYSNYNQSFAKIITFERIVIFETVKEKKNKLVNKYHLFLMVSNMIYSCIVATLSMMTLHTVINSAMHGYILSMQKSYMISHNQDTNNAKYNSNMINVISFNRLKHDMLIQIPLNFQHVNLIPYCKTISMHDKRKQ